MGTVRDNVEMETAASAAALSVVEPVVMVCDLGLRAAAYNAMLAVAAPSSVHHDLDLLALSGSGEMSISRWADGLEELLDSIPTVSAICVADGVGTLVLEHFAATRPDRVARLVLVSPLHRLSADRRREYADLAERLTTVGVDAFIELGVGQAIDGVDLELVAKACRAVADAHTSDLRSVKAPTLICTDGSIEEQADGATSLLDELPRSQQIQIAGSGMNLSVTNPTELGEAVRGFLVSTSEQPRGAKS